MKEYNEQVNLGNSGVDSYKDKTDQSTSTMYDSISSLFQPDTVVTFQYFDNLRRKNLFEPERRLMLAILDDAVNCFQDNVHASDGHARKLFDEAEEWILEDANDYIFSFENICEVLGFDPRYLRLGLLRWKQQQVKHAKKIGQSRETRALRRNGKMSQVQYSNYSITPILQFELRNYL